jgi:hypothetical protein
MDQKFPSNANVDRENPLLKKPATPETEEVDKKIEEIVTDGVKKRKVPFHRRVTRIFFSGDVRSVKNYIVQDVLVPTVRYTVVDAVQQAVSRAILGENAMNNRHPGLGGFAGLGGFRGGGVIQNMNYGNISQGVQAKREDPREVINRRTMGVLDPSQFVFQDRTTAEQVVLELARVIEEFGIVTVADMYKMIGEPTEFTHHKYGWNNLAGADVIGSASKGWVLNLPRPSQIN